LRWRIHLLKRLLSKLGEFETSFRIVVLFVLVLS